MVEAFLVHRSFLEVVEAFLVHRSFPEVVEAFLDHRCRRRNLLEEQEVVEEEVVQCLLEEEEEEEVAVGVRQLLDFEVEVLLSLILQVTSWDEAEVSVFLVKIHRQGWTRRTFQEIETNVG